MTKAEKKKRKNKKEFEKISNTLSEIWKKNIENGNGHTFKLAKNRTTENGNTTIHIDFETY